MWLMIVTPVNVIMSYTARDSYNGGRVIARHEATNISLGVYNIHLLIYSLTMILLNFTFSSCYSSLVVFRCERINAEHEYCAQQHKLEY